MPSLELLRVSKTVISPMRKTVASSQQTSVFSSLTRKPDSANFSNANRTTNISPSPDLPHQLVETNLFMLPNKLRGTILNGSSGGTVDMIVSPNGAHFLGNGKASIIAKLNDGMQHQHFKLFKQPVDSSNISRELQAEMTAKIVKKFQAALTDKIPTAGMVITHGTDTIMETAALLSYQHPPIPVVITGSWVSAGKIGSDAVLNIKRAKQLAATMPTPGAFVVIGNDIHLGSRVNKVRSGPFSPPKNASVASASSSTKPYFISQNDQPIGHFNENNKIFLNRSQIHELQAIQAHKPDVLAAQSTHPIVPAAVEHLLVSPQTPMAVFQHLLQRLKQQPKHCGAVMEGELGEHPHAEKLKVLIDKAQQDGIYLATTAQQSAAKTWPLNVSNIPPIHLRAKLAALLGSGQPDVLKQIPTLLKRNLTGEVLTESQAQKTWLTLPFLCKATEEALVITPAFTAAEISHATQRLISQKKNQSHLPPCLTLIGYGNGHVPIGSTQLKDRILQNLRSNEPVLANKLEQAMQSSNTAPEADWTLDSVHQKLSSLLEDQVSACQHLQSSLINSHPSLKAIGEALKQGIDVRMDTKLPYAPATLKAYEIGTILDFIGVKPV